MYNLLIVDDENLILDSYYEILYDNFRNDLNIDKCPTSRQALSMAGNRIDILVTDIFMPELNGYELQQKISEIWPKCRIIFLTGNTNVSNAQKAIRSSKNIIDYVLKFDDDEVLIKAVNQAIESLDNEIMVGDLMKDVQRSLQLALPILRKEFIIDLLSDPTHDMQALKERLEQYQMDFTAELPLVLLCGNMQDSGSRLFAEDNENFDATHFAVDNILKEYLAHNFNSFSIVYDKNKMVWLLQPKPSFRYKEDKELVYYIYSYLDIIQDACSRVLKTTLNFVMSRNLCSWRGISDVFSKLMIILEQNRILNDSIIFLEDVSSDMLLFNDPGESNINSILAGIEKALLTDNGEALSDNLKKIVFLMTQDSETFIRLHFEMSAIFIKYMKKVGMYKITYNDICGKLIEINSDTLDYEKLLGEYTDIVNSFTSLLSNSTHNSRSVIDAVIQYVDDNITGDLSLTTVATTVFHSPTYLSKLFKRTTGVGFCKYVINQRMKKAGDLVLGSDKKINEIAAIVGFESVPYFIKTFKKTYNLSPQEYRNAHT